MTEPFCPATILLTRPATADYDRPAGGGIPGGSLTTAGRAQARELSEALVSRRVALVYTSPAVRAVQTAEIVAAALGCAVRARSELADVAVGPIDSPGTVDQASIDQCPLADVRRRWEAGDLRAARAGGESAVDVLTRLSAVFEQVADEHRGETVLVVGHGLSAGLAVARLARNLSPDYWFAGPRLRPAQPAELISDAAGLRVATWGGRTLSD